MRFYASCFKQRLGDYTHLICNKHLFTQTDTEDFYALCELRKRFAAVDHLVGNVAVPYDRARNQLRKQRKVGTEVDKALADGSVVAVNVDNITHCLEGVEADTDRQTDMQVRNIQERQHIQRVGDHARVFEHREYSYIKYAGQNKKQLFLFGVLTVFIYKPASDVVE